MCSLAVCPGFAFAQTAPQEPPRIVKAPRDVDFGVGTHQAALERHVEMYQWTRDGGGYRQSWRDTPVDSSEFAPGHDNPKSMPLQSREWRAQLTLEGKPLDDALVAQLGQWRSMRPSFSALPGNMAATFQPEGEGLGSADNPLAPRIGDLRITWRELVLPPLDDRLVLGHDGRWALAVLPADPVSEDAGTVVDRQKGRTMPKISLLFAALHALLLVVLAARVSLYRMRHRIDMGDGGDALLIRRIRVHANFIEYVPMGLLLLLVLELAGLPTAWLWGFGSALLLGRVMHAIGLSRSSGKTFGRFYGTGITWLTMAAMAFASFWLIVRHAS
jgi:uncharacterized membrane protein YecN with MAPEG domain